MNSLKEYELTVLIHPDLETDLEKPLTSLRKLIKDSGGEIIKETSWGKKKLAYPIGKESFAVYVNFELNLPPSSLAKLSSTLNITETLLRYLLVSVDEKTKAKLTAASKRREAGREEGERDHGEKH